MTLNDIQRAAVVLFAAREAGLEGSLDQMRAVCHVIRNRVTAQWHEDYLAAVEEADQPRSVTKLRLNDRRLAMLTREVDAIFYGSDDSEIARLCGRQGKDHGPLLYWTFIDRPISKWFVANVVNKPQEHRQRAKVGNNMYLYE
jgi:hypothetical protein